MSALVTAADSNPPHSATTQVRPPSVRGRFSILMTKSASPSTGMFALWVTIMICRANFRSEPAALCNYAGATTFRARTILHLDDEVSVSEHGDVRVVGDDHDLPSELQIGTRRTLQLRRCDHLPCEDDSPS